MASSAPVHFSKESLSEFKAWYAGHHTFLLDLDGVVWLGSGSKSLPSIDRTIAFIKSSGKRVFYVSNNSTKSRAEVADKLHKVCGVPAREDEVITSGYAASLYLSGLKEHASKGHGDGEAAAGEAGSAGGAAAGAAAVASSSSSSFSSAASSSSASHPALQLDKEKEKKKVKKVYVIGEPGLAAELRQQGLEPLGLDDGDKPFTFGDLSKADLDPEVGAVIVGFDRKMNYRKLATATLYLQNPAVLFISTNRDRTFPDTHATLPGSGALIAFLECSSGRQPDFVAGKPSQSLLTLLEERLGVERGSTCFVGDRLDTDILFANTGGLSSSLCVLTGVTKLAELEKLPAGSKLMPTHILDYWGLLGELLDHSLDGAGSEKEAEGKEAGKKESKQEGAPARGAEAGKEEETGKQ